MDSLLSDSFLRVFFMARPFSWLPWTYGWQIVPKHEAHVTGRVAQVAPQVPSVSPPKASPRSFPERRRMDSLLSVNFLRAFFMASFLLERAGYS
jgi:hypothetical protein